MGMKRRVQRDVIQILLFAVIRPILVNSFPLPPLIKNTNYRRLRPAAYNLYASLDVILFGCGDFRIADHEGLARALGSPDVNVILPLVLLDKYTLRNIPMASSHPKETASILSACISSLRNELRTKAALSLNVHDSLNSMDNMVTLLNQALQMATEKYGEEFNFTSIKVHVCDLGPADSSIQYNPYSILSQQGLNLNVNNIPVQVQPWKCTLTEEAWNQTFEDPNFLPSRFDHYQQLVGEMEKAQNISPLSPCLDRQTCCSIPNLISNMPSSEDIANVLKRAESENDPTGLFMTHWGGLNIERTLNEQQVLASVQSFIEGGDEALLSIHSSDIERNFASLEHASISRLLNKNQVYVTENLIFGEILTRFIAAPLMFGLISNRQLSEIAQGAILKHSSTTLWDSFFPSRIHDNCRFVQTFAQNREWHQLLATKNILLSKEASTSTNTDSYKYWRWHGFLCRYSLQYLTQETPNTKKKNALVWVHGFGASGSQFSQTTQSLSRLVSSSKDQVQVPSDSTVLVAAPDLLGFGQSEKPPLTYTQYLWESFVTCFTQDIVLNDHLYGCDDFVIGGNSIGGYTAMGVAADDSKNLDVTSSGARGGSGKCKGLILMNSAGRILSKTDLEDDKVKSAVSVTEATTLDMLGSSRPIPRWIGSVGGTLLLSYLRPRIESICVNLYPTNPSAVKDTDLCLNILRDSLDPGALNVMISGSKLPPPRTANELLGADYGSVKRRQYEKLAFTVDIRQGMFEGPVLVAQGILDPLNDAKGRAQLFYELRKGIDVDEIQAGHCPHDELPDEVARSVSSWLKLRDPFGWNRW